MGKIKRSVSMILSVLMASSVFTTAPVSAATVEASDADVNTAVAEQAELKIAEGSCGDKLTWTLGNDGVLEISGEGKMYDFDFEAKEGENSFNPWTLYRDRIKKVVVKDGVEYIGNFAFFGFAELEEAQIADSVKEIGENAFEGCEKLDKTTLPEAFTEPAKVEETTKSSPVIVKEEEEAVGAAAEEAVGASVSISKCTIALSTTSCTYSYCERKPVVTVKNGSKTLENGTDYKLTYKNNINPGTATVTITGKGSYTGSVEKKFTVNKRDISTTDITLSSKHYTYSGNAKKPTVTATYNSHTLVKDTDYTVTYKNNTNVGTATVTITGTGKYFTGSVTKSFSIHRKSLNDCTVSVDCPDNEYDGKLKNYTITVKDGSKVLKQDVDYTCTVEGAPIGLETGKIGIVISGKGIYKDKISVSIEIKPRNINNAIGFVSKNSFVLDDSNKIRYMVFLKDNLNGSLTEIDSKNYKVTYVDQPNGMVDAIIEGKSNYCGTKIISYRPKEIPANSFVWGRDNWSFNNSSDNFLNGYKVFDSVLDPIAEELSFTSEEKSKISEDYKTKNDWGGSCYGMSLSSILSAQGYLDLGKYTNSSNINEVTADENSTSVINCFQASYCYADISYLIREATKCGKSLSYVESTNPAQPEYIKAFENEFAKDSTPLLVVFRMEGKKNYIANHTYETMSHAVVAYGIDDCQYNHTFDYKVTKTYDKRILIYDPNDGAKNAITNNYCIYYNSSDYSWVCPAWTGTYNCYWDSYMGTSIKTGSISSITKIHSISVAENVLNHVSYDYLTRKYPSSVGADEGISDNIDFKWATLDDLVENENALSVSVKGDVNGDGSVDVSDANAIQMYLAGITELSDAQLSVADANNDGVVSVDDSLYIQLMLAELV